jgi:hypothetical protein
MTGRAFIMSALWGAVVALAATISIRKHIVKAPTAVAFGWIMIVVGVTGAFLGAFPTTPWLLATPIDVLAGIAGLLLIGWLWPGLELPQFRLEFIPGRGT